MLILLMSMTFGLAASCSESSESSESSEPLESSNLPGTTGNSSNSNCPTKTCADFETWAQAQAAYESNRNCYKNLDRDGNGKACESLK
ncbi:excalibur calcium-binding domain-containing protein [Flavobacterium sp. CFS9]